MGRPQIKRSDDVGAATAGGGSYFASEKENVAMFSSGCTMLDCVLGGGWAKQRMSNLIGDKSTGKTLLVMEAAANFLRTYEDGEVDYKECESAFDPDYMEKGLGISMNRINLDEGGIGTIEDLMRDIDKRLAGQRTKRRPPPVLYIVDSLDSVSDEAEMEREIGKGNYGANKAKALSEFFRKKIRAITAANITLIIVSQVRDNLNAGLFGKKFLRSGGKALDFYASQVIWLYNMGQIKRKQNKVERVVGIKIKAKNDKNKVGLPFRECGFTITFGYGVEDELASEDWLNEIDFKRAVPKDAAALRQLVVSEWNRIETAFLPTKRKYE